MSETLDSVAVENKRPTFLTVLCILSFVGAGISIVVLLLATVFAGAATAGLAAAENAGAEVESAVGNIWAYLGVAAALIITSLVGVIKMWKLQKSGFYMYTVAAIAGIIVDIVLGAGLNVMGIVFAVAFIAMYAANLKAMK